MISIDELETPALLVDLDRMERNLDKAADYSRQHGIALRPHIKTHKSTVLAAEQLRRGAVGVTCATPFEAEVMSDVTQDVLVMYPPVGPRASRLAQLARDVRLTVALDSEEAARDVSQAAMTADATVRVLVEMDAGMHRVGVKTNEDVVALARFVESLPRLEVAGIAFYPGHVRGPVAEHGPELRAVGRRLEAVLRLMRAGFENLVVSAGSTPTMWQTHLIDGVTEMRPGTYIFNDRTTALIGACTMEECALTVLATVVSTAVPGQAVIDAGSKALGREPLRGNSGPEDGFGSLLDDPTVTVKSMSEEHGILDLSRSSWRPRVGERVRVVPNHVCIVVHLADVVYGVREGAVISSWPVAARGRGQPGVGDPSAASGLRAGLGR